MLASRVQCTGQPAKGSEGSLAKNHGEVKRTRSIRVGKALGNFVGVKHVYQRIKMFTQTIISDG